jgi:hypothetical protein
MCKAIARTCNALKAAAAVDIDRTPEDRLFFAAEAAKLEPVRVSLVGKHRAIEDYELGDGDLFQTSVELGDEVLDRGVRNGNTRTKFGLKGKSGVGTVGADHAFGTRINELTDAPHRQEPDLVLGAVSRLDEVPDFDDKAQIKADLTNRVELQEGLIDQRDNGHKQLAKLESEAVVLVVEGATKLAQTKAALDGRFPRQREYVARFFLDVSYKKRNNNDGGT